MEVFLRDSNLYLREILEKNTKNSERLGGQARQGIEPGTSRLPVLCAEPLTTGGATYQGNSKGKEGRLQQEAINFCFVFASFLVLFSCLLHGDKHFFHLVMRNIVLSKDVPKLLFS